MSKFLISVVETYRTDSEKEAKELIESAKNDRMFTLKKYGSEYKERKQKGEVIDAWYKVTLNKCFTDEKEPSDMTTIKYESEFMIPTSQEEDDENAD